MFFEFIKINYVDIVSSIVTLVSIVFSVLMAFKTKRKKAHTKILEIVTTLPNLVKKAESLYPSKFGAAKLLYVMQEIKMMCLEDKIKFNADYFKNEVEKILETPEKKKEE